MSVKDGYSLSVVEWPARGAGYLGFAGSSVRRRNVTRVPD